MRTDCDPQTLQHIKSQINRTEGQVLSLGKMFESNRDCSEIMQQIVATRASLQKLGTLLLEAEAQGCFGTVAESDKIRKLELIMSNLFKIT